MASSDKQPGGLMPSAPHDVPGDPLAFGSKLLDKSAKMLQSLTPIKQLKQHICTWALYSQDRSRQIEVHLYVHRLNEDFQQCVVYDSDEDDARLIGIEYIISGRLFLALPDEEKRLWHSHFHEVKSGLAVYPGVPDVIEKQEMKSAASTYGKFWCTWQIDRGDRLPLGIPALMVSPEDFNQVDPELIRKRDEKYKISTRDKAKNRANIESSELIQPMTDHWKGSGKGLAVDLKEVDMILGEGAPLSTLK